MTEPPVGASVCGIVLDQAPLRLRPARSTTGDRALVVDLAASVLLLGAGEVQVWLDDGIHHQVLAVVGVAVLSASVALRRRTPTGALIAAVVAVAVDAWLGGSLTQVAIAIPVAWMVFYAAGAFQPTDRGRRSFAVAVVILLVQVVLTPHVVSDVFFEPVLVAFTPWLGGVLMQEHRQRELAIEGYVQQLGDEAARRSLEATESERTRIAREIHDVVGSSLSVVVLQAGGARLHLLSDPDRAVAALDVVERSVSQALSELRRLLDVYGADPSDLHPQPGLDDLVELVDVVRLAGMDVSLRVEGRPLDVPASVGLSAYRIVQEALTNTIRHARSARADVLLRWRDHELLIDVTDNGRSRRPRVRPQGHGLIGMLERAQMLDGELTTGRRPDGGFQVSARLPIATRVST